jgi:signal transduction histidine kinase
MTEHNGKEKKEVWEQWDWVWHVTAYLALGINVTIFLGESSDVDPMIFLGLSAMLALWYIPFISSPLTLWQDNPKRKVLYLILGWILWVGLIILNVESLLLAAMFYPLVFSRFIIRWAIALAAFQTLGLYLVYVILYEAGNWLFLLMVTLGFLGASILIGAFVASLIKQSVARQHLLDELTQTRARLLKSEREAGILAERQRLAREIHDTLAQNFTSVIMHLSAAKLSSTDAIQTHVEQAEQTAREGLDEARRMIWDKSPGQLENASLIESLEKHAARWSVENDINVAMDVTGDQRTLDAAMDVALLRIFQEALHNIKKHASAKNVNITLSYMPDLLILDIADDGQGFIATKNGRGFGMTSMRERAEELGGELTVESEPGKGTNIAVSIPIMDVP